MTRTPRPGDTLWITSYPGSTQELLDLSGAFPAYDVRATHEPYNADTVAAGKTCAAVLIVRDPRDVAWLYARENELDLDGAIDALASQSWSDHAQSWLAEHVPFPVICVRYETLCTDPDVALTPIRDLLGAQGTNTVLDSSTIGRWKNELSSYQIATVELDHHQMMTIVGYTCETTPPRIARVPSHIGLRVRLGPVPEVLPDSDQPVGWLSTTRRATTVRFEPDKALMVEDGTLVTIEWPPDTDDLSWLVQGWSISLATLQRNEFSLHASTVGVHGAVIALAGRSGAGKSTTCMALRQRGHQLLVDDTTLLGFRDGQVFTTPYSRNVHLLPDAAAALGIDFDELPLLAGGREKASFTPEAPPTDPRLINRIIVLNPQDDATEVSLIEVHGLERLSVLREHVARSGIGPLVLGQQRFFQLITDLANAVPVFLLTRPRNEWSLETVLDLIEGTCS